MNTRIYIHSPSSAVRDRAAFRRGVRRLKQLGYEVDIDPGALGHHQRFAGSDDERVAAIERAAASGADVVLISRGGYGLTRLLGRLPYDAIARSIQQGTRWVGLSDFTAFQLALMAQCPGSHTWAGPALGEDFGADPRASTDEQPLPDDIMEACFDDLVHGVGEGTGWRLGTDSVVPECIAENASSASDKAHFFIENSMLWGGNLSLVTSLVGTPYLPEVNGGILFLEDVGEHPYRIERMLTQLLHAGVLNRQRALLLGQFTRYQLVQGYDRGFGLRAVVGWLHRQCPHLPLLTGLPFGHVPTKVLLPVGLPVDLLVQGRQALITWGHLDTAQEGEGA